MISCNDAGGKEQGTVVFPYIMPYLSGITGSLSSVEYHDFNPRCAMKYWKILLLIMNDVTVCMYYQQSNFLVEYVVNNFKFKSFT